MTFRQLLIDRIGDVCRLSDSQVEHLVTHYNLLVRWNQKTNLTSVRNLEELVTLHYCESLFAGTLLPAEPVSVADVGSGAGFPGVPMAVLRPDCRFALIESNQRKAVFLREATRELSNVRVLGVRAETVTEPFDWMVSRAVKSCTLPRLGRTVAMLLSETDADTIQLPGVTWQARHPIPWGKRRVVLIGSRAPRF